VIYDTIIIGGGFYGIKLSLFLAKKGLRVLILEKDSDILNKSSKNNQARVHNGYHYPRSYKTALSSHKNYSKFINEYKSCTYENFKSLYAIAHNSKTSSFQFEKFCNTLNIPLKKIATEDWSSYINKELVEASYLTEEIVFNFKQLKSILVKELNEYSDKITIKLNCEVQSFQPLSDKVLVNTIDGNFESKKIFNVTYAGINHVLANSSLETIDLKYEVSEICLINAPKSFEKYSLTIMDGPFFSIMPFPAKNLHSIHHVSYTPHSYWNEGDLNLNPYDIIAKFKQKSNFFKIKNDVSRYLPAFKDIELKESMFEVKAVVSRNEIDDGRPIVLKKHTDNVYSILGSKLDNIYDLEKKLLNFYEK
jgi:hypothetical protein